VLYRSDGDSDPLKEPEASSTEEIVVVVTGDSDVEKERDGENSTCHSGGSNVFVSRSLPVPLESSNAQADAKAVLNEAISTPSASAAPSLFNKGPDGVIVLDAEPDVDLLLQQDTSSSVSPVPSMRCSSTTRVGAYSLILYAYSRL